MAHFEKVSKYADVDLPMPVRKTNHAAGYDMVAAEDYIIPSIWMMFKEAKEIWPVADDEFVSLEQMAQFTKETGCKPTLISTGVKCQLTPDSFLQLSVRSSSPLKYWLMLANGVGIIDADYYNNADNEGEIFFQVFNLSPFNIQIKKGETIGQGVVMGFRTTFDDNKPESVAARARIRTGGFGSTDDIPLPPPLVGKEGTPEYEQYMKERAARNQAKMAEALKEFNESIGS